MEIIIGGTLVLENFVFNCAIGATRTPPLIIHIPSKKGGVQGEP
jgi:hypothetical protein